jgi:FkbM family methyltransferase
LHVLKTLVLRFLPRPLLLSLKKLHYVRQLRDPQIEEEPDLEVVKRLVREGTVALDIGANVGLYTRLLSSWVGESGRVVSLEPIPDTCEILRHVIARLHLSNATALQFAASDRSGQVAMALPKRKSGEANPYQARITGSHAPSGGELGIQAVRLDDVVERLGLKVDFVKIDVEGHELACVTGGLRTIEQFRPAMLIEISGNPDEANTPAHTLCTRLAGYEYCMYWFDGVRLRPHIRGEESTNYFFLQSAHLQKLEGTGLEVQTTPGGID